MFLPHRQAQVSQPMVPFLEVANGPPDRGLPLFRRRLRLVLRAAWPRSRQDLASMRPQGLMVAVRPLPAQCCAGQRPAAPDRPKMTRDRQCLHRPSWPPGGSASQLEGTWRLASSRLRRGASPWLGRSRAALPARAHGRRWASPEWAFGPRARARSRRSWPRSRLNSVWTGVIPLSLVFIIT